MSQFCSPQHRRGVGAMKLVNQRRKLINVIVAIVTMNVDGSNLGGRNRIFYAVLLDSKGRKGVNSNFL